MADHRDLARELIGLAEDDRAAAAALLDVEGVSDAIVAFHAQQAVEKSLKAVLASRGVDFPFTHDLAALLQIVRGRRRRGSGRACRSGPPDSLRRGGALRIEEPRHSRPRYCAAVRRGGRPLGGRTRRTLRGPPARAPVAGRRRPTRLPAGSARRSLRPARARVAATASRRPTTRARTDRPRRSLIEERAGTWPRPAAGAADRFVATKQSPGRAADGGASVTRVTQTRRPCRSTGRLSTSLTFTERRRSRTFQRDQTRPTGFEDRS
jgi:HEPN domain-containing protein